MYDSVKIEALWELPRMYYVNVILVLLNYRYGNSLSCGRIKGVGEFLDSDDEDEVMEDVKIGVRVMGVRFAEEEGEWRMLDLLSLICR